MLVFIKVTDYNKIVKKDKSARRWSVAMTEKKHAIKPYPLGAHVEDGAIRFAYASGKKDCGIILYDRESGKKLHKIPFRREERMGNVYCKYLELDPPFSPAVATISADVFVFTSSGVSSNS